MTASLLISEMDQSNNSLKCSMRKFIKSTLFEDKDFQRWICTEGDCSASTFDELEEAYKSYKGSHESRMLFEGAFDMTHSGHFNAVRQAKESCGFLVLGVNGDEEITKHKGPPIMTNDERVRMFKACKWVDEVVGDLPYVPTLDLLDTVNCKYIGHGDDIILGPDGKSIYSPFEEQGRMRY